jgi:hypothetical protein
MNIKLYFHNFSCISSYFDNAGQSFFLHVLQNAGAHTFSVGVTEAIASNLLLELSADDIQYFYQR